MEVQNFEDLIAFCVGDKAEYRILYVFLRIAEMDGTTRREMGIDDDQAAVVQILFDAHQPIQPGLNFDQVREAANAQNPDWSLCVVGVVKSDNATMPSEDQAQHALSNMRERVLAGELDDYIVLDRNGAAVFMEPDAQNAPGTDKPTIN